MIQQYYVNYDLSKEIYSKCSHLIEKKQCYNNVFNILTHSEYDNKFHSGEWKFAYGFVEVTESILARHAFIIDESNQAVDPTLANSDYFDDIDTYISFKVLNFSEYLKALHNNGLQPALFHVFMDEEIEANKWARERDMVCVG